MTQSEALSILKLGHTTFLTGPAGSGKSYVLREYVNYLKKHNIKYAVTASTGIASTHISGTTIHSWSGIGIKDKITKYDLDNLEEKQNIYKRYSETDVVIIDEISMLSSNFLDMFDKVCKHLKRNEKPFGGMQIVFCGDFFQLPPINRESNNISYAYESISWQESKPVICYLTEQHRQKEDILTDILFQIRGNNVDEFVWEHLESRKSERGEDLDREILKLYTHNVDVDKINEEQFSKLKGEAKIYEMISKGKANLVESLKKNCLAEETLKLKIGASVICIKNDIERKFVNGSMGEIIRFENDDTPVVKLKDGKEIKVKADSWKIEEDGKVKAELIQLPLKLAWAITIHKSQGMTLDEAEIDLSKAFSFGMGYVALSRLRSISGLYLKGAHSQAFAVSEGVAQMDLTFQKKSEQASGKIKNYTIKELETKWNKFILDCGGSIKEIEIDDVEELYDKKPTIILTKELILEKKNLDEIVSIRSLTENTVVDHIEKLIEKNLLEKKDIDYLMPPKKDIDKIKKAFKDLKTEKLTPVFEELKEKYSFQTLKLVRLIK